MPQRLSFSTLDLLQSCERLYQLERLLEGERREESDHLVFGKAYGLGVAVYLETQDPDQALYQAYLAYVPMIDSEKKCVWRCMQALIKSFPALDNLLEEYELVSFQSRPACELSFRLDIDPDYYYVGYIDAVLKHRYTKQYVVFECKTTGLLLNDLSPLYKHSGQALGYSIVLDQIVGEDISSYGVLYFVCQLGKDFSTINVHVLPFNKTLLDRLNWFIVLGLDVQRLHQMHNLSVYPRRYTACLKYNRACRHFGTCHLHSLDRPKQEEPDEIEYQFIYQLDQVVESHLKRIAAMPAELQEIKEPVVQCEDMIDLDCIELMSLPASQPASQPITRPLSGKEKLAALLAKKRGTDDAHC